MSDSILMWYDHRNTGQEQKIAFYLKDGEEVPEVVYGQGSNVTTGAYTIEEVTKERKGAVEGYRYINAIAIRVAS